MTAETDSDSASSLCHCGEDVDAKCRAEETFDSRHPDGNITQWCTRPEGHDGPHAACTTVEHPAETWGDD